jgi:hypothetical protein
MHIEKVFDMGICTVLMSKEHNTLSLQPLFRSTVFLSPLV